MEAVIKVKLTGTDDPIFVPQIQTRGAAGADLRACVKDTIVVRPLERALIPTGISVSIPIGYEGQVRPRSGLAFSHGITLLNTPGTIDSDYRGEIKVILINLGSDDFLVKRGDRIAQIVFSKCETLHMEVVERLDETERGGGGFGSTAGV